MPSFITLLAYLAVLEVLRRCSSRLIVAFTGPLAKIPGPFWWKLTPIPWMIENITGNALNITPGLFKKYGNVVRVGPKDILVAEKHGIQKILVGDDLQKSPVYEAARPYPEVSNLISERDKKAYKDKRRLLSPGFSIAYLNGLESLMLECIRTFEETLDSKLEKGNVVDIAHMLENLTSDVMSATSLGGSLNLVKTDDTKLKSIFLNRLKRAAFDASIPFIRYLPFVPPQSPELSEMIGKIVAKRRAEKEPKNDLLQIFIDANKSNPISFSELHIEEEMVLFMIAGSDTTSGSAIFILIQLLHNPETLRRLLAEIDEVFPSANDLLTFANTQDLAYLNAVINEGMRVMPVVNTGLSRITTETTIVSNYEMPPGTMVAAFTAAMARDENIWPDPQAFVPERWLGEYKGVEADRKAFMPFSAGSRNCIGQQFALKELRLILVTLLRRYELSLVPGQSYELRSHTVTYLKQGFYNVTLKRRSN